ncbi:SGNH/GDSL hydrolase family protein [Lactobacillus selangorensis]|nr:SGNH/GDSL hydrolase family protein [Lactobacillus selangorensis]
MKKSIFKLAAVAGVGLAAYHFGPHSLKRIEKGNQPQYAPEQTTLNVDSVLYGKKIGFLGSSITYGAAAHGVSFVDYLRAEDGVLATKSAISGTTLAGNAEKSYVKRLVSDFDPEQHLDAFVCQLSTNDGRAHKQLGAITPDSQRDGFDQTTTLGAIEFICAYVQAHFDCPLVFYTCLRKPDSDYADLIQQLYQLQTKWQFQIIDLWADPVVNSVTKAAPDAMFDDAHPTQLGYEKIWTPVFEKQLSQLF